jgi:L-malate glycosyltransferase
LGNPQVVNILHLSTAQTWRGGEQQIAYLMEELHSEFGAIQTLVCPLDSELARRLKDYPYNLLTYKKSGSISFSLAFKIKKYCLNHGVQIIHAHDSHAHTAAVLSAVLGNKVPVVVSRRVDFKAGKSILSSWKYNHPAVKKIIAVSHAIADILAETIKSKDKICTVHSGIDLNRFNQSNYSGELHKFIQVPLGTKIIGNVAALAGHKDLFTFMDTASIILKKYPDLHFVIMGEGEQRHDLEAYRSSLGLQDRVHMPGFVTNIEKYLPGMEVFLMTSSTEGLGTSLLDAMAAGVPVVATDTGGIPELILHEKTGLLAPVKGPAALADAVIRILNEQEFNQKIVMEAFQHLNSFSRAHTAYQTLQIYKEVLHGHATEIK